MGQGRRWELRESSSPTLIRACLRFPTVNVSNANPTAVLSVGLMDHLVFFWEKSCLTFPSNCIRLSPAEPNHPNLRQNPHNTRSRRLPKTRALRISSLNTNVQKFFKAKLSSPVTCSCDPPECRARPTGCWSALLDRSTIRLLG